MHNLTPDGIIYMLEDFAFWWAISCWRKKWSTPNLPWSELRLLKNAAQGTSISAQIWEVSYSPTDHMAKTNFSRFQSSIPCLVWDIRRSKCPQPDAYAGRSTESCSSITAIPRAKTSSENVTSNYVFSSEFAFQHSKNFDWNWFLECFSLTATSLVRIEHQFVERAGGYIHVLHRGRGWGGFEHGVNICFSLSTYPFQTTKLWQKQGIWTTSNGGPLLCEC